jgi:two-component system, OmpR family, sensor histidine kinase KdpD
MDDSRPDPDVILSRIQAEEKSKLTVFLGAAAGVGKTYAMLQAARERLAEGVDVVAGWVETHGRKETEALLEGLTIVPPRQVPYRGIVLEEMDLDAILERRPELVMVDELAHRNVPTSRHNRRIHDVTELLEAGISVYTTINIQHIESLNDVVEMITGVRVRETVPDLFIAEADLIQLIDIPADALIQRLKEGKVYVPDLAGEALRNFFRPGNLNALRELTLRFAAHRVDRELYDYRQRHGIKVSWPAADRVLACIGPSPYGIHVLRAARRLADSLRAELIAVYVETPWFTSREEDRENLSANIKLAAELGAEVVNIPARDVSGSILELTEQRNITHIVMGHPLKRRWREFVRGSVTDRVIAGSKGLGVHLIPAEPEEPAPVTRKKTVRAAYAPRIVDYIFILALIAAVTALCKATGSFFSLTDVAMLYLLPVLYAGARTDIRVAIGTSLASLLLYDLLFVPPLYSITVANVHYLTSFFVFLLVAVITSLMATNLRRQVEETSLSMSRTRTLYDLSKELAAVSDTREFAGTVAKEAARAIGGDTVIYLPDYPETALKLYAASDPGSFIATDRSERAVAVWTFEHGQEAGSGTDTLPGAKGFYVPLKLEDAVLGVIGTDMLNGTEGEVSRIDLLVAISDLASLALNKVLLSMATQHVRNLEQSDRLRNALFDSISHELRTPLASIIGAVTSLTGGEEIYSPEERASLLSTIETGATRMNRLVRNLLDMARLESGSFRLNEDWCDIEDLIGVAASEFADELKGRHVDIAVAPGLPLIKADFELVVQVLSNLIDNAIKYSPEGSEVEITARSDNDAVVLGVGDRGAGIPDEEKGNIFDKFYRMKTSPQVSGTGLGLSICKGIVEAHGGSMLVKDRPGSGSLFLVSLPVERLRPEDLLRESEER